MLAFGVGLLALVADTLLFRDHGLVPLQPERGAGRGSYLRDAVMGGTLGALGVMGIGRLADVLAAVVPFPHASAGLETSQLTSAWPAGSAVLSTAILAMVMASVFAIATALALTWLRKPARIIGDEDQPPDEPVAVAPCVVVAGHGRSPFNLSCGNSRKASSGR